MAISEIYREPDPIERQLLERLLEVPFPGHDAVAEQLRNCRVRTLDDHGSLQISVLNDVIAPVQQRVPVEAEATDRDGNKIHMLLHVVNGKVDELEFYSESGSPIRYLPPAEEWELIVLPPPPG